MAGKKLNFIISADNNPAIQALSQLSVAIGKINSSFKSINSAQKAAKKTGGGGLLDEKELNSVGGRLKDVNDIFKTIGVTQQNLQRDSGFKGLKNSFNDVTQSARGLFSVVSDLMAPIMTLTGAGVIGGISALANNFGKKSARINDIKTETGMEPRQIQQWINTGSEFGIPKDTMMSGLESTSKGLRDLSIGQNPALLGFFQNQLGIKDVYERVHKPGGVQDLMKDIPSILRDYQKQNPLTGTQVIADSPFAYMQPMLSAPDDIYQDKMKRAGGLFNLSNKGWDQAYRQNAKTDDAEAKLGSDFESIGHKAQPYWTKAVSFLANAFNGEYLWDQKGINLKPLGNDIKKKFGFMDEESESDKGLTGSSDLSDGISVKGPAPKEQTVKLVVDFNNAPKGMTVTPSPDSVVRVQSNVRYAGFDIQ